MKISVKLNNLRIAPRKTRMVADIIRGKKAEEAKGILNFSIKGASGPILKLLNSALSNAKNIYQTDADNLYISKITVDEGIKMKRWMPRARGSASEITKRSSIVTLVLDEINPVKKHAKKTKAVKESQLEKVLEKDEKNPTAAGKKYDFNSQKAMPKPKQAVGINKIFRRKSV